HQRFPPQAGVSPQAARDPGQVPARRGGHRGAGAERDRAGTGAGDHRGDAAEAARDRADAVAEPDEDHRDRRRARRRRGYRARAPAYGPGQTGRGAGTVLSARPGRREGSGVMTADSGAPQDGAPQDRAPQDGAPQDGADLFVADFYPKLGEYLAEQHAAGYDAGTGRARFQAWLGEHAEGTAGADPVRDYLKQIGKVPGLTIEQEAELAQRIEAGLYAVRKLAEDGDPLTPSERIDLEWVAEVGTRARNHLLEANLRLVVSLAKRYTGRGMPFLD